MDYTKLFYEVETEGTLSGTCEIIIERETIERAKNEQKTIFDHVRRAFAFLVDRFRLSRRRQRR